MCDCYNNSLLTHLSGQTQKWNWNYSKTWRNSNRHHNFKKICISLLKSIKKRRWKKLTNLPIIFRVFPPRLSLISVFTSNLLFQEQCVMWNRRYSFYVSYNNHEQFCHALLLFFLLIQEVSPNNWTNYSMNNTEDFIFAEPRLVWMQAPHPLTVRLHFRNEPDFILSNVHCNCKPKNLTVEKIRTSKKIKQINDKLWNMHEKFVRNENECQIYHVCFIIYHYLYHWFVSPNLFYHYYILKHNQLSDCSAWTIVHERSILWSHFSFSFLIIKYSYFLFHLNRFMTNLLRKTD